MFLLCVYTLFLFFYWNHFFIGCKIVKINPFIFLYSFILLRCFAEGFCDLMLVFISVSCKVAYQSTSRNYLWIIWHLYIVIRLEGCKSLLVRYFIDEFHTLLPIIFTCMVVADNLGHCLRFCTLRQFDLLQWVLDQFTWFLIDIITDILFLYIYYNL